MRRIRARLGLLLPAAARRLLPVDDGVARRLVGLPALARLGDSRLVATVEQFEAALVVGHLFRSRVVGTIEELIDTHPGQRIAVVCHGGVINGYLCHVLGLPNPKGFFYPNYTSINRVAAARGGIRSVVTINETAHLRGTGLPMGLFQGT